MVMRDWLEKNQVTEEGLCLEVPKMDDKETDPPLEDCESADVVLRMMIS